MTRVAAPIRVRSRAVVKMPPNEASSAAADKTWKHASYWAEVAQRKMHQRAYELWAVQSTVDLEYQFKKSRSRRRIVRA